MLFKDIIGQQEVKQHLIELVQHNRLSHALLFLGKEGSGALPLPTHLQDISVSFRKAAKLQAHPYLVMNRRSNRFYPLIAGKPMNGC
jgi:hypothetical protein